MQKSGYGAKLEDMKPLHDSGLVVWQDYVERIVNKKSDDLQETILAVLGIQK